MKKFLLEMLVLLTIILLSSYLYYAFSNNPRKKYLRSNIKIETRPLKFFVGDSHVYSFNPSDLLQWHHFNFAYPSDNYLDIKRKIIFLCEQGYLTQRDTLFLQTDLHLFSIYRQQYNNNDISGIYLNELRSLKNFYFPFLGERAVVRPENILVRYLDSKKVSNLGEFQLGKLADSIKVRQRVNDQFQNFKFDDVSLDHLRFILSYLKERKISVVGIRYPVHPYYTSLVANQVDTLRVGARIESLFKEGRFITLNYRNIFSDVEYFSDQDHLSRVGSDSLLSKLKMDLNKRKTDYPIERNIHNQLNNFD